MTGMDESAKPKAVSDKATNRFVVTRKGSFRIEPPSSQSVRSPERRRIVSDTSQGG
jgi:hypothetical protein